ncbi:MAG: DUF6600 domain-containing protein [Chloroflexota bacterium]
MKRVAYMVMLVVSLSWVSDARSASYGDEAVGDLHTSFVQGDVQIMTTDTSDWVPASINMPLREGDRIWVPGGGRLELYRRDGTVVRLDEKTSLDLLATDGESLQVYLAGGRAYVGYRGRRNDMLQIDSPVVSMRVYGEARLSVGVGNSDTEVAVYRGLVYAESRSGRTEVAAGNSLLLRDDSYADLSPLGSPDEWESWNRERDERFNSGYSRQYLPDELRGYSNDFDTYGKWAYVREYGNVWTPTVGLSAGWAPYRSGRWVWVGGDYVWISYDPWGWVPHHYGRWVFIAPTGWCWIPPVRTSVYWSPGYVGWVYTPEYVAWVPLSPGDVYYGYGYYGPRSVNLINANINKITVNKVYRNVQVRDAVTVVNRQSFVTGRGDRVAIRGNPFLSQHASVGSPRIRPEKSSFIPVVKDIPQAKQPPRAIRELRHEELKRRRPFVKERSVSVLSPQVPKGTMPMRIYDKPKGAGSRSYMEKEATGPSSVRLPDNGKPGSKRESVKGERGQEARPTERRRDATTVPQPVPSQPGGRLTQPGGQSENEREKKSRPPDNGKPGSKRESVKGERGQEARPAERRRDATIVPQPVPSQPGGRLSQPGSPDEGRTEKTRKGYDTESRGGREAETRGLRGSSPGVSLPSEPGQRRVEPQARGRGESPEKAGQADKSRERRTGEADSDGVRKKEARKAPPVEEKSTDQQDAAQPRGGAERGVPGRQYESRDRGQGPQDRQMAPPAYPFQERR